MGPGRRLIAALAAAAVCTGAAADPAAWRIEGAGGGEIALLGSMHVLRASDHPLPPSVDALYERADSLVMELDLDDLDAATLQRSLLGAAVLPAGKTLRDVLAPSIYASAEQRARSLGLDLELLERVEPWLVAVTLLDAGVRKLGFVAERGLEQYVLGKARRDGKEVLGLESAAAQVAIFDGLAPDAQQEMLEQTLQELDEAAGTLGEMAAAWRDGRLDVLAAGLLDEFDDFPGLYETLIVERNENWATTLEPMLDDGRNYLVVVGALHLLGPDSLIDLLEARGHTVAPLTP